MTTLETLRVDLESKKQLVLNKETEVSTKILSILTALFPQVIKVSIRHENIVIGTKKDNSAWGHEITINNDARFNQFGRFIPSLSWFSSSAKQSEVDLLEYLEVLGYVAREIKSVHSPLMEIITAGVEEIIGLDSSVSIVFNAINDILRNEENIKKEEQEKEFNENLKVGNYYIKEHEGRFKRIEIIKIVSITPKIIKIMSSDNVHDHIIDYFERSVINTHNIKKHQIFGHLKTHRLISLFDLTNIINEKLAIAQTN